jgi:hypothetical protein
MEHRERRRPGAVHIAWRAYIKSRWRAYQWYWNPGRMVLYCEGRSRIVRRCAASMSKSNGKRRLGTKFNYAPAVPRAKIVARGTAGE